MNLHVIRFVNCILSKLSVKQKHSNSFSWYTKNHNKVNGILHCFKSMATTTRHFCRYKTFTLKILLRGKRCKIPHEKILSLAKVMIFWKSRFACNYRTRKNLKALVKNSQKIHSFSQLSCQMLAIWFSPSLYGVSQIQYSDIEGFNFSLFYGTRNVKNPK